MRRISVDWARMAVGTAATAGILAATAAAADPADVPSYGHYGMMGYGGWDGWIFGPLMMVLFFGALVGAVILIVRLLRGDHLRASAPRDDRALSILRARFAKGAISQEEFESARKALE